MSLGAPQQCTTPNFSTIVTSKIESKIDSKHSINFNFEKINKKSISLLQFHQQKYVQAFSKYIPTKVYDKLDDTTQYARKDLNLTFNPINSVNAIVYEDDFKDVNNGQLLGHKLLKVAVNEDADPLHAELIVLLVLKKFFSSVKCNHIRNQFMTLDSFFGVPITVAAEASPQTSFDENKIYQINTSGIYYDYVLNQSIYSMYPSFMFPASSNVMSLSSFIQEKFNGLEKLRDSSAKNFDYNDKTLFFDKLNLFYKSFIYLSKHTGFFHNDLHTNNILYNNQTNMFLLIDYGRAYVNKYVSGELLNDIKSIYNEFKDCDVYKKNITLKDFRKYRKLFHNKYGKKCLYHDNYVEEDDKDPSKTAKSMNVGNLNNCLADLAGLSTMVLSLCNDRANKKNHIVEFYNDKCNKFYSNSTQTNLFKLPIMPDYNDNNNEYFIINTDVESLKQNVQEANTINNGRTDYFILSMAWMALFVGVIIKSNPRNKIKSNKTKFRVSKNLLFGENEKTSVMWKSGIIWPSQFNKVIIDIGYNIYNVIMNHILDGGSNFNELEILEKELELTSKIELTTKYSKTLKSSNTYRSATNHSSKNMTGGAECRITNVWLDIIQKGEDLKLPSSSSATSSTTDLDPLVIDSISDDEDPSQTQAPIGGRSSTGHVIEKWVDIYKAKEGMSLPTTISPLKSSNKIFLKKDPKQKPYKVYLDTVTSHRYIKKNNEKIYLKDIRGRYNLV